MPHPNAPPSATAASSTASAATTNSQPDQREDQKNNPTKTRYTSHEVTALRAGGPSGRTHKSLIVTLILPRIRIRIRSPILRLRIRIRILPTFGNPRQSLIRQIPSPKHL